MRAVARVFLLGSMRVQRADGSFVACGEWRTSKTRQLLALMAVRAGQRVRVDDLVERLWPRVGPERARGSLRTALFQIRRVLGPQIIKRIDDALLLNHAWVDSLAYESLATDALNGLAGGEGGDPLESLRLARRAGALYQGDLCADEAGTDLFTLERERLRLLHVDLQATAAHVACQVGWTRAAVRWARAALELDASCERAYRALMRAYWLLGESDQAQRVYGQCRRVLVEEFGVDPSPATQDAHKELLTLAAVDPPPPFVGRAAALARARVAIRDASVDGTGIMILLGGVPGSGRTRFAQQVCAAADLPVERVDVGGPGASLTAAIAGLRAQGIPSAVLVEQLQRADPASLQAIPDLVAGSGAGCVILATVPPTSEAGESVRQLGASLSAVGVGLHLELGALTPDEVGALASKMLGGPPDPALLNQLLDASRGLPGPLAAELLRLRGSIEPVPGAAALVTALTHDIDENITVRLERLRPLLTPAQEDVLEVAAVVGCGFRRADLRGLASIPNRELGEALDLLEDHGLVVREGERYRFASTAVSTQVSETAKPSVRSRAHALAATHPDTDDTSRVDHWIHAGEPDRACATALEAAPRALSQGRYEDARRLLLGVVALAPGTEIDPVTRIDLLDRLAEACAALGSPIEARAALDEAIELAAVESPTALPRLYRRRGDLDLVESGGAGAVRRWYRRALVSGGRSATELVRTKLAAGAQQALRCPKGAELALTEAVTVADQVGRIEAQVEARACLARMSLAPQRRMVEARRIGGQAVQLAERQGRPELLASALLRRWEPELWVGHSGSALESLERSWRLATDGADVLLQSDTGLAYCLALHDCGHPDFEQVWPQVWPQPARPRGRRAWRWPAIRMLTERGLLNATAAQALHCRGTHEGALDQQLVSLHAAVLHTARGQSSDAARVLSASMADAATTKTWVVLPEAAARLAAVEAARSPRGAQLALRLAERTGVETLGPRERWALLLGRAKLLAARCGWAAACDLAGAAVTAARAGGLPFLEAEALLAQAHMLDAMDDWDAADKALDRAAWIYQGVGAPARVRQVERSAKDLRVVQVRRAAWIA